MGGCECSYSPHSNSLRWRWVVWRVSGGGLKSLSNVPFCRFNEARSGRLSSPLSRTKFENCSYKVTSAFGDKWREVVTSHLRPPCGRSGLLRRSQGSGFSVDCSRAKPPEGLQIKIRSRGGPFRPPPLAIEEMRAAHTRNLMI